MDPLTHATLGVAVALAAAPRATPKAAAALVGLAAGTLPDTDIFLSSATDPLFNLEYHRHFTHSFLFSPIIALIGVGLGALVLRLFHLKVSLGPLLIPSWLAGLSHLFCDLWTSYGTRVCWPFTTARSSLDWISVIDPLFTLPLLLLTLVALIRGSARHARRGLLWAALYLSCCALQHHRASTALDQWFARNHPGPADRTAVHPSFGNILVWRGLLEKDGQVTAVAIRCGLGTPLIFPGESARIFNHPEQAIAHFQIDPTSLKARDVRRFFHFSANWVGAVAGETQTLGDLRYATLPDSLAPLWGIQISPGETLPPVQWRQFRTLDAATWNRFVGFILGDVSKATPPSSS